MALDGGQTTTKNDNQPNVRGRNERGKRYDEREPGGARGKGDTIVLGRSN
jgi:hypothetical protein